MVVQGVSELWYELSCLDTSCLWYELSCYRNRQPEINENNENIIVNMADEVLFDFLHMEIVNHVCNTVQKDEKVHMILCFSLINSIICLL